ncbi:hypothetical protein BOSEA31B_20212 [Hyphomicrobiales bacterium]|nr:hypothetical protein BOSEA31B_20212 [Hyphomicrobiales bacterium]CAH1702416.1 hypothetical protein BOSEA1005_30288 [Hyphomicrobiales bacterium]CAI0346616.1 hypothetical protein BO1005MUT1_520128 [Hyphomicrobiales bacterium]
MNRLRSFVDDSPPVDYKPQSLFRTSSTDYRSFIQRKESRRGQEHRAHAATAGGGMRRGAHLRCADL